MEKVQTMKLLKWISTVWNNFTFDEDTIEVWGDLFADCEPKLVKDAVSYLIKTRPSDFAPTAPSIFAAMRELSQKNLESPQDAWDSRGSSSELAQEAWDRWGGDRRWGALPDPKYSDSPGFAERTLEAARKEYFEVYTSIRTKREREPVREALNSTSGRLGIE